MIKCWVFPKKLHQSHNTFGQWQLKIDLGHYLCNLLHLRSWFVWVLQSHHNFVVPWVFCKWCFSDHVGQGLLRPVCYANGTHQLDWKSKLNSCHLRKCCFKTNILLKLMNRNSMQIKKHLMHFQQLCISIKKVVNDPKFLRNKLYNAIRGNITQLIIKIDWKKPKNWYSAHPFSLPKTVAVIGSKFSFD